MTDPVALTAKLIRCRSVTPADDGALAVLEGVLAAAGFACHRIERGGVQNLFARWGDPASGPSFGFNGHTDVVPPGPEGDWSADPFGAEIRDGRIWGRGAADMKSGVAAFVAAAVDLVAEAPPKGSIVVTVTGDEEGASMDGTRAILDWMAGRGEPLDACLVGAPTSRERLGDMIKIGRRGSMTATFTATGRQGHTAYPQRALNPLPAMARLMDRLAGQRLDDGTEHFDPSTLAITTIDTGNPANNVIPGHCTGRVNIRFNDAHSSAQLGAWLKGEADRAGAETGVAFETHLQVSGESFLTPPGPLTTLVAEAIRAETGIEPELSTSGGTSDARFIKDVCPVVEVGLAGQTMHQADENVPVAEIHALKAIYARILRGYLD